MNNRELWQAILGELELVLSKASFVTWFSQTSLAQFESGRAVINVPNTFVKAWLEKKHTSNILKILQKLSGQVIKEIVYRVEDVRFAEPLPVSLPTPEKTLESSKPKQINKFGLNQKYTFKNFVVGKGNEFVHAAAQAVAENPGKKYNPLFIYGGVGLGKTHIAQAIGHDTLEKFPKKKVLYITCEKFTNDFINSVRSKDVKKFKDVYRNVDVLLIDDIQFIISKHETQEEFFHTFNALHQEDKQIVISSDRPPKAFQGMGIDDRMLSRFECGVVADISTPGLETRIAILETKCKEKNINFKRELLIEIATRIQNNIRELEGALNKIIAHQQIRNISLTKEMISDILSNYSPVARRSVTSKQLIDIVANYYGISMEQILGKSREQKLSFPRQITMYLMREELSYSYPTIGKEVGGRDHTTAMHAHKKINKGIESDAKLQQDLDYIKQRIYS
ncbi:MAG: chromosomal replication initiator protein DnaA [Patescibacteria group bacterium]|nr:chromosomal replication initiator protein DnaA [Patescibacteria group bacterium]